MGGIFLILFLATFLATFPKNLAKFFFNLLVTLHTHKTKILINASTSFFLLFFLCLLIFHWLLLQWDFSRFMQWGMSGLLFSTALISVGFSAKRDLFKRILWKLKLAAARFETSTLLTFYHWKNFCRYRGLNPGLHSQSCLWCNNCKAALMQTWKLDNSSTRWGV